MSADAVIAIIPARGGSVRMPRKNITSFMGVPLISWTVKAALESGVCSRTIVSTDDPEIAQAALDAGAEVPFLRPAHLATSTASTFDVINHLLENIREVAGRYALLQPTSPLRTGQDIAQANALMAETAAPAVVSVSRFDIPWPVLRLTDADGILCVVTEPPGGLPGLMLNGAIYLGHIPLLRTTKSFTPEGTRPFVMPAERSVDIDTPLDFQIAEAIARNSPDLFPA